MSAILTPNNGKIILPHEWTVRPHQTNFGQAMMVQNKKRAVCVWHRRAGKDSSSLNFTAVAAHQKVASYWHMLPTAIQGRHVVWDAIDPRTGVRTIDQVWPKELRANINNTEMKIELKNGSIWQVVGSDNYDRLVGSNPYGVVFSEYSIADPRAWDFIRPILSENGGWAIFIYTPRGKNHGYELYEMARNNPNWFAEILTIDNTQRQDGSPVVSKEAFQEELDSGMDFQLAQQEYYCSFDAGLFGAYFTDALKKTKVGDYPYDPRKPVHTFWDLGLRDATSIWFLQEAGDGSSIHAIDYMEGNNIPLIDWCTRVNRLQYNYGTHVAPHDIMRRDYSNGVSYLRTASAHGIDFEKCPDIGLKAGIEAVQSFLPRIRFNKETTGKGVDALYNYRREYNDKLRVFMDRPVHDWASHGADSMRMASIAWPENWHRSGLGRFTVIPAVKTSSGRVRKRPPRIARG